MACDRWKRVMWLVAMVGGTLNRNLANRVSLVQLTAELLLRGCWAFVEVLAAAARSKFFFSRAGLQYELGPLASALTLLLSLNHSITVGTGISSARCNCNSETKMHIVRPSS